MYLHTFAATVNVGLTRARAMSGGRGRSTTRLVGGVAVNIEGQPAGVCHVHAQASQCLDN